MTQLERDLRETRALISREENWCQGRAYIGHAMCIMGALRNVVGYCGTPDDARMRACAHALLRYTSGQWLAAYNDTHKHPEVLGLLDKAIKDQVEEKAKRGVEELKELLHDSHHVRDLPDTGSRAPGEVKADA